MEKKMETAIMYNRVYSGSYIGIMEEEDGSNYSILLVRMLD